MTYDEAFSAAILGERVRPVDMQAGAYIDYQFAGLRINFPGGSSSGWHATEHDKAVEWEVWQPPAPVAWPDALTLQPTQSPAVAMQRGGRVRRGRKPAFVPPAVIDDVEYSAPAKPTAANPGWGEKPLEPGPVKIEPTPAPTPTDSVANGWAIFDKEKADLTSEPKPASGWAIFNKDS